MKKILFILFLFAAFQSFGQNRFPSIDSAKNYTLRYYRNSTVETFTNLRGQNIAYGTLELIDSLAGNGAIDSIWFTGGTPDTLRYRKAGTTFTIGTISGGGGSTSLNNVGTGFDLAQQGTANVKRIAAGTNITLDSTGTANTVVINASGDSVFIKVTSDTLQINKNNTASSVTIDSLYSFGNSIADGDNATVDDSAYVNRFAAYLNKPLIKKSLSGSGIWKAIQQHHLFINTSHSKIATVQAGLNDLRRNGWNYKTVNKISNGYKSIFANHYLKSFQTANAGANVTRYGTWTLYSGLSVGAKTNAGAFTQSVNDSIVYTFTDTTVVVGLMGADQSGTIYNYGNFDVYIDNVFVENVSEAAQYDGVSDGVYDNKRGPMCVIYTGLTNSSHTIKLVAKSTDYAVVDYFGHLVDVTNAKPLIFLHVPKLSATGYAASPSSANDVIVDLANARIDSLVKKLPKGYPLRIAKTNLFYTASIASGDLDSDNIHPTNQGHRKHFNAIVSAYESNFFAKISLNETLNANVNGVTKQIAYTLPSKNLTESSLIMFDADSSHSAKITLTGNRTLAFAHFESGQYLTLIVVQGGSGGYSLTLPGNVKVIAAGLGSVALSTDVGSYDILTFHKDNDGIIYCNYGKNYN